MMEHNSEENKSSGDKTNISNKSQSAYKNSAEYIIALEKWLQEAYMWQCVSAWFPYMLMSHQLSGAPMTFGPRGENPFCTLDTSNGILSFFPNVTPTSATTSRENVNSLYRNIGAANIRRPDEQGITYKIPPLWKRFLAEFLDFLLLFAAKLVITFVAVEFLDLIDLDKYDFDHLQQNDEFDYQMAIDMLSELFLLELVHNIVACIFEAVCIRSGSPGHPGGATPGKNIMGLRVVMCDHITTVNHVDLPQGVPREGNFVRVTPGGDLGFWWAFNRSFVKNFFLAFFFPVCLTMFFSNHNRTIYDNVSHSLVVEEIPRHQI